MKRAIFQASFLAGTIIGAGVFALPFIFKTVGVGLGFLYLILGALVFTIIHLMYADVVMRTGEQHRFLGYAEIYLGRRFFWPVLLMTVVETVFVLAIYLILSKSFSQLVGFPGGDLEAILFFWFISSFSIFLGLRKIAFLELLATGGMIAIIGLVFLLGLDSLGGVALGSFSPDWKIVLLPLGAVLFALSGRVAIPSLVAYDSDKKSVRNSVIIGTFLPALVYGLFILSVLGLSLNVSEDSVSGLIGQIPFFAVSLVGFFGLLSLWTSYIAVGFDVYKSLLQDLRLSKWIAPVLIAFGPLAVYFFSSQDFIRLVGFVGGIFLALESLLIIIMWLRADRIASKSRIFMKNLPSSVIILAVLVFLAALGYEIIRVVYGENI